MPCPSGPFVPDSRKRAKDFCFRMFLTPPSQHRATCRQGNKKASLTTLTIRSRRLTRTFGAIMTSISAATSSSYTSPLQKLQEELQAEAKSGAISSAAHSALCSALTDINPSLQSGHASQQSGNSNSSPGDLKSKIDGLIANEVSSGKLTSSQATELQGVFQSAFANGGPGGPGGAGGAHHGHHGGPPPPDSSSSTDSTGSTSSTSSSSSSSSSSSTTTNDILQQFLQSLQNS